MAEDKNEIDQFEIVERNGGWAVKSDEGYSTTFASREDALEAAREMANAADRPDDEELSEGLEETFPASDPVAATNPTT